MPKLKLTADILAAAILGFEVQKIAVDAKIAEIHRQLGEPGAEPAAAAKPRKKRSAAVRRKMALAQRARYAQQKKGPEPAAAEKPKRTMSAAGKKRIAEAQKKRWAAAKKAPKSKPAKTPGSGAAPAAQ